MNVFILNECVHKWMCSFILPVQGSWCIIANNQSGLENKQNNTLLFFISLCPWNVLSYKIVSLAVCCVCVSCKYYRAHYVWWLEIDLNKVGGEGAGKRGQGERAGCSCFACTGLLWEKELTGRRSAASSSQTTAAQKEETSWGWCDMSRSFSISLLTCLPLPFTKQTRARHACNTLSSRHSHKHVVTVVRFIRNWQGAYTHTKPSK